MMCAIRTRDIMMISAVAPANREVRRMRRRPRLIANIALCVAVAAILVGALGTHGKRSECKYKKYKEHRFLHRGFHLQSTYIITYTISHCQQNASFF